MINLHHLGLWEIKEWRIKSTKKRVCVTDSPMVCMQMLVTFVQRVMWWDFSFFWASTVTCSFFAMMKILAKSFVFSPKFSPLQTAAGHEWWIEEWDEETIDFSHDERWTRGEFSPTCQLFAVAAHTLSRLFLSHRFVRFARSCCLLLLLLQESFAFLQLYTHDDDFDADDTHIHGDYHCR